MAFDYLENIVFTILILLYPTEIGILPIVGVSMSFVKWIFVGLSMVSTLGISIAAFADYIADTVFGTIGPVNFTTELYQS